MDKEIYVIGRREMVSFPLLYMVNVEAKVDTGAFSSAIHCDNIRLEKEGDKELLCFTLEASDYPGNKTQHFKFEEFTVKKIKNSFGEAEERFVIKTIIKIGEKNIKAQFSLSDRKTMRYPVLIGRRAIKGKFIIDVMKVHLNGQKLSLYLSHLTSA